MATMSIGYPVSTAPRPLRLTRRGRALVRGLVALAVAAIAYLVLSLGTGAAVQAFTQDAAPLATHAVVVQPGDTLWSIAARELPNVDPREGILRLRTLNAMEPADRLIAGSELLVPAA